MFSICAKALRSQLWSFLLTREDEKKEMLFLFKEQLRRGGASL